MSASGVMLAMVMSLAACGGRPSLLELGEDASPGILANRTLGMRPWDPPDRSRPTVVIIHGFNPVPNLIHFRMADRFAEALAARGGTQFNLLSWEWNAATFRSLDLRVNQENALEQGRSLAAALRHVGVNPGALHLIGHSSGAIVAASAARCLTSEFGQRVAHLTMLDTASYCHAIIFERLAAGTAAARVENYWGDRPSGYGRPARYAGVWNMRVPGPTTWLGVVSPGHSDHVYVVRWYLATIIDPRPPAGFNLSVLHRAGR
jgi:pimeloyl-ACP methyl ester carboxylesterase